MSERIIHMRYGVYRDTDTRYDTGEVATLLWENPDLTANFPAQDVDLGQSVEGFKYLRIVWQDSTGQDDQHIIDYDLDDVEDFLSGAGKARLAFEHYATTYRYERSAYFTDENYDTLHFYNAIRVTTNSGNVGTLASQCIPAEISGVNIGQVLNGSGGSDSGEYDTYTGTYSVVPQANQEVVLSTANKLLTRNVTVQEVPYYETSNEQGGYTAYIAQEVE
ncbi:MAG: hypothetical protein IJJ44_03330 [Solobacterium sp.]|nr:hypothetical protein [Solobacterium sp.]